MRRVVELQGPEQTWFTFCPTPQVPPLLLSSSFYSSLLPSHQSPSPFAPCADFRPLGKLRCADATFISTTRSDRTLKSRMKENLRSEPTGNNVDARRTSAKRAAAPLKSPWPRPRANQIPAVGFYGRIQPNCRLALTNPQ